jgi:hypothetical protein
MRQVAIIAAFYLIAGECSMHKVIMIAAALAVVASPSFAASTGYYQGESSRASAASTHKIGPKKVAASSGYYKGEPSRASSKSKMKIAPKKPAH